MLKFSFSSSYPLFLKMAQNTTGLLTGGIFNLFLIFLYNPQFHCTHPNYMAEMV